MAEALTNATLRRLKPRARTYEVTCGKLSGFAVRVLPSGKKVFVVRVRRGSRDARVRLGQWETDLSLQEATSRAMAILAGVEPTPEPARRDTPPARSREAVERASEPPKPSRAPTVRALADRFLREYVEVYLKPGTRRHYRRLLREHILPAIGDRPFDTIARRDAKAIQAKLRPRGTIADYALCVLGSLYTRIIDDWELSDMRNPAAGIKRKPSRRVERFLSPEERRAVLAEIERGVAIPFGNPGSIDRANAWALKLLMLTGQRRGEILGLTWQMVDWQHACFHFPDTKTGQRSVAVSRETLTLLKEIHDATGQRTSGLVLRGRRGTMLSRLNSTWKRVCEAVGITDVRLHDLRHSFASDALMAGVPLAIVGELLGHKNAKTTERYAHLADRVVREGLEKATRRIVDANPPAPPPAVEFVPLSDAQWERVAAILGADEPRPGPPVDLRAIVDGIRWVLQRGARWYEVPAVYGRPTTCWRWHTRWVEAGVWEAAERQC